MFVTLGAIDKAAHMWGAQADAANFTATAIRLTWSTAGAAQTHVSLRGGDRRRPARARSWTPSRRSTRATAARPWSCSRRTTVPRIGQRFYGKTEPTAQQQQLVLRPAGCVGRGVFTDPGDRAAGPPPACITSNIYNQPSPALQPLIDTGNVQFSYQSTAIETWLIDHSVAKKKEGAAAMLQMPGVIAVVLARRRSIPALRDRTR